MVTSHLPLVRYHRRIERVGLDLADRPDAAEGVGLDGVDHRVRSEERRVGKECRL